MNTHSGQAKTMNATKINHIYTIVCKKQRLKYLTLGEKIDTPLNSRKTELTAEMIEVFYFRLLPVTYRNWMNKCNIYKY